MNVKDKIIIFRYEHNNTPYYSMMSSRCSVRQPGSLDYYLYRAVQPAGTRYYLPYLHSQPTTDTVRGGGTRWLYRTVTHDTHIMSYLFFLFCLCWSADKQGEAREEDTFWCLYHKCDSYEYYSTTCEGFGWWIWLILRSHVSFDKILNYYHFSFFRSGRLHPSSLI